MFVALAEEGWTAGPDRGGRGAPLSRSDISTRHDAPDTLVLGCTHFPVLVRRHSRGVAAARAHRRLGGDDRGGARRGERRRHAEDRNGRAIAGASTGSRRTMRERFARVGGRFFGEALRAEAVEIIDL